MERIDKKYAIIYIDRDGEVLEETDDKFTTKEIATDFYNNSGFLQWNFYIIISKESLISYAKKQFDENGCVLDIDELINEIQENDIYTRKYVIESDKINEFINDIFPDLKEKTGEIKLIKGKSWSDAQELCIREESRNNIFDTYRPSWYRNLSLMDSLTEMDKLRARLIKNDNFKVLFYTHLSNEYSIAEKKFKLLQKN